MGITEAELEEHATREARSLLDQFRAERALERLFPPEASRILTKEDCLQFFRITGYPTTGSLVGVYRWAANLDEAKFNFEEPADLQGYSFLNAYD